MVEYAFVPNILRTASVGHNGVSSLARGHRASVAGTILGDAGLKCLVLNGTRCS
jgi:hypothetical protein